VKGRSQLLTGFEVTNKGFAAGETTGIVASPSGWFRINVGRIDGRECGSGLLFLSGDSDGSFHTDARKKPKGGFSHGAAGMPQEP
jgi:hypothetical protein